MGLRIKVTVELPKKLFQNIHVQTAIAQAQRRNTAPDLLKLFHGTVEGWENKPDFTNKQIVNSRRIEMDVYPRPGSHAYNIYKLVNLGAPRHAIPKKSFKRKWLRFRSGYISSTISGSLMSHSKQRTGDWWGARQVNHPGFTARNFDMYIVEEYKPTFYKDMQEAIDDAVKNWEG